MKKIILTSLILCLAWFAGAQSGSVTATSVAQRTDGSGLVDVYFNLSGDGTNYFIKLDVSFNAGSSYSAVNSSYTSGDIGPVNPGTNKHIVWNALHSHPNQNTANAKLQITATTGVFPNSGQSCPGIPTVSYGGKVYTTVKIGTQCWLRENLNVGVMIQNIINQANNSIIEKYCYNNDEMNCNIYGGLYQWNEMMDYTITPGAQGICPPGWHIPTDDEWKILEGNVDSQYGVGNPVWNSSGVRGFDAGKMLKSISGWSSGGNGLDSYGFSALPSGRRGYSGGFSNLGITGFFWTSSEAGSSGSGLAWLRYLDSSFNGVSRYYNAVNNELNNKSYGYNVRCLKD